MHEMLRNIAAFDITGINDQSRLAPCHTAAEILKNFHRRVHIGERWAVMYYTDPVDTHASRENRKRAVFGTLKLHLSLEFF